MRATPSEYKAPAPAVRAAPERMDVNLSGLKAVDEAEGIFEGYLAYFNNVDSYADIIDPGAFTKTLSEAKSKQTSRKSPYLYPLLWQHSPDQPIGGILEAREDKSGLYIKAQVSMDIPLGQQAYDGLKKGYVDGLSIGYDTVQAFYDDKKRRHLREIRLWEGSVVTFPANDSARVQTVKSLNVTPSGAWPITSPDYKWDGKSARERLVKWAEGEGVSPDAEKLASVHFWHSEGEYHLPFCDVVEGVVVAVPSGIMESASDLHAVPTPDRKAVQERISAYCGRVRAEFKSDEQHVPPWEIGAYRWKTAIEAKRWGGLQTLTYCASTFGYLMRDTETMLEMLGAACGLALAPSLRAADGEPDPLSNLPPVEPIIAKILELPGLKESLFAISDAHEKLNVKVLKALSLLGMYEEEDTHRYAAAEQVLSLKEGRVFSTANYKKLRAMYDSLTDHSDTLKSMLGDLDSQDGKADTRTATKNATEPEHSATTPTEQEPSEPDDQTTLDGLNRLVLEGRLMAMRNDFR